MRGTVMRNIGVRRIPLIAFGVVGPPEACLVTGYDESGKVLIGWSYFQEMPPFNEGLETEPGGQFRRRGWPDVTESLVVWGDRLGRPPLIQVYRGALAWALRIVRTPVIAHTDRQGLDRLYGNLRTAVHRLGSGELTVRRTDEAVQIVRLPKQED